MKYLSILFILFSGVLRAQQEDVPSSFLGLNGELKAGDVKDKYQQVDFSELWTRTVNYQVKGMIGENHQRIRIALTSISQNLDQVFEYLVLGKSKVKTNICNFSGTIRIDSILELKEMHYGVDSVYKDSGIVAQGVVFATYEFKESLQEEHSGVFKGQCISKWYINYAGELNYDDIEVISDAYMNNAFIGTWTHYGSINSKVCTWADYRIPFSADDFDRGAAEFSPSEKYYKFGWEQHQKAWLYNNEEAKKKELEEWWR